MLVFDRDFAAFTYEENGSIKGLKLDLLNYWVKRWALGWSLSP
jgi:hypothetical protein